ncbi:hypothetical protein OH76DRAFT_1490153 [Lentinus brumalis]|uniref:F-box domain-containing protein n=1 Tax=Lentinus brumalis TaxID=2498619 RepID=A0A371CK15_9APHY|nr:hypothetical protein OH76DRAFT_1490153 [Polyporus brumalis]
MVLTRSQRKANMAQAVAVAPLRENRNIFSMDALIAFVELATFRLDYGTAVTHLDVELTVAALQRDSVESYLRICFALVPNLEVLELLLFPPPTTTMFNRLTLPYIQIFKANIPHRSLAQFFTNNPSLRAVDIASCGRSSACPLESVDMSHVTDIRCPIECSRGIVHEGTDRLRLDITKPSTLPSNLLANRPVLDVLHVLTIDFIPTNNSILKKVATLAPWLCHLRLLEKTRSATKHIARPWRNTDAWARSLRHLAYLQEIVIRTAGSLSTVPGDRKAERAVFRAWVGSTSSAPHPTIYTVTVWQRVDDDDGGIVSQWSRENGEWKGIWMDNPRKNHLPLFK